MKPYFFCNSIIYPSSPIRSFCLSFLLIALLLTCLNILTTTTSINRWTSTTQTTSSSPPSLDLILQVNASAVRCPWNPIRQHFRRKKLNLIAKKKLSSLLPRQLNRSSRVSDDRNAIPYDYDLWQSAPLMPRLVSKCEYQLMMALLKRFDQLTRRYSLEYMIADGTLLGSWRHHDLIPWDDDIDLLMSVQLKSRLDWAIAAESPLASDRIEFHRRWDGPKGFEYYKFYFSSSPRFTEHPWRYPFVDLIFYHENRTHLWPENMQDTASISKEKIYPLTFRPFGPLWLPAPRSPPDYFLAMNWTNYDQECFNGHWSHKYERLKGDQYDENYISSVPCRALQQVYPFVRRSSSNQVERLVINQTIIQIFQRVADET